jgi:CubicO group peptidase (beta-lactamase class C family)
VATGWVKTFLETPVVNEPGTKYQYNSMASFMLSAIVQKVTGEKVIDYLTPRLFEPLGIEGADWETNPEGINTGGWGLRLKTEDLAKFGQLYLQKGKWNGKEILPEKWVEEATSLKIYQNPNLSEAKRDSSNDSMQGYYYAGKRCDGCIYCRIF